MVTASLLVSPSSVTQPPSHATTYSLKQSEDTLYALLQNATIYIDNETLGGATTFRLQDGSYIGSTPAISQFLASLDEVWDLGDINNDGIVDAVGVFSVGYGGRARDTYLLGIISDRQGSPTPFRRTSMAGPTAQATDGSFVMWSILQPLDAFGVTNLEIRNGAVNLATLDYQPGDSGCCPTGSRTMTVRFSN